ncbi:MAG TPA: HAMP domain-containing sensor histidine kinase [Candidatus Nitrosopolaris rasttigaisensis]|nr:HAMP domain-containing sensor histidine kinase [Candidatus Nitrosopolaris rasttigaisensis]
MASLPPYERTEVLDGVENANNSIFQFLSNTKSSISVCSDSTGPSVSVGVEIYSRATIDLKNRGVKVKHVTEINNENIHYCKDLMKVIDELRHLDGVKGNFAVSETEYLATAAALEEAKPVRQLLYSNMKTIVEQQQYIFDTLWNKAIPAEQKIKEIEEGIEPEYFEVFTDRDRERVSQILLNLAKSVKKEALILLPNAKAMIRVDRLGAIDHIINASQRGATVKIICPLSEENSRIIRKIDEQAPAVKVLSGNNSPYGMYIMDGEKFLRAEVKEPDAETFSGAIGFSVYSNSKLSVDSFRSVFELLWNEHTLNEELKRADKMQKQFINVAAHELRTPVQPILGVLGLLRSRTTEITKQELDESLDLIMRNALRLKRLAEDILDVTKIESQSLVVHKELLNLNEVISGAVQDIIKNQFGSRGGQILYDSIEDTILVEADRFRLNQVVSNLLSNAVKFTKRNGGTIHISMKKKDDYGQEVALVSVKDTGVGIDPEIFPRLFEKFASKSFHGTGLGLFLSRSIIEAQGGRIWAENNTDGQNGATFYFTLPIISNKRDSQNQTSR